MNPVKEPISITGIASVSALGAYPGDAWETYGVHKPMMEARKFGGFRAWVSPLPTTLLEQIRANCDANRLYRDLDDSVKYALFTAREAMAMAGWKRGEAVGVNIGSSRGATGLFEKYHAEFLRDGRTSPLASPTTTLGNISSWVAHDLQLKGPDISHSITCSTALHALLNGMAWIRSGMARKFIAGGSEAPLTPFTLAQMQALKIYAEPPPDTYFEESDRAGGMGIPEFPSRALDLEKTKNSMVLGEGAAMACLEAGVSDRSLAIIEGIGYATEPLEHNVSLSTDALCFQRSMRMALGVLPPASVDVVVLHAPGTLRGDRAEYNALGEVFGPELPALTTNKWLLGHTFGASGMLSLEFALLMLKRQQFIGVPFLDQQGPSSGISRVLVNAVGFGGNAVSVLLRTP